MNKQQLASTIWESANEMRSKIEANEYKDFILGFIFYKYLSEKEERFFKAQGMSEGDIKQMDETDQDFVNYTKDRIGYFISYNNLFSTWLSMGNDFDVSNVREALSAFNRLISSTHKNVFDKIFNTLQTGLSKLGETASTQTKAISKLIQLINKIPMDGKQDYDVLGYIYEYLIEKFAANAGKKAGEFYTPHEVSVLMSNIVADHLKDRKEIKIYDPTSGSGSLLINIGAAPGKYIKGKNKIKYYAQEWKENTYNLTRMNLVMRGIEPSNIFVRNGDTLEDDWPFFEDNKPETFHLVRVDAVVSNPPYSQKWETKDKNLDPRFSGYGVAPKGRSDYAFLLHDLYHLEEDGILTIVLPHGVLFRGKEEETIRTNLIEKNNIDAIIGLPENLFYGTSIPTIIMVLKKKRDNTDVLFIDASRGYEKADKKNVLRSSDIKRIANAIRDRKDIEGFARLVTKKEIQENNYNLNIPRYLDTSVPGEKWDIHAIMFGGIPKKEVALLDEYWMELPGLKEDLFREISSAYVEFAQTDIEQYVQTHSAIEAYRQKYIDSFAGFRDLLVDDLIGNYQTVSPASEEERISADIFKRLRSIPSIDPYSAYQALDDAWNTVAVDVEILQTEGESALTAVDDNIVTKQKEGKTIEVSDGWGGRILPFELVQKMLLPDELAALRAKEAEVSDIASVYEEVIDTLDEDDKESDLLNDNKTSFNSKAVAAKVDDILQDISSPEISALEQYLTLSKKKEKETYIAEAVDVRWKELTAGANGLYTKASVTSRIRELKKQYEFPEDSFEAGMLRASKAMDEERNLNREIKAMSLELHEKTRALILSMDKETALTVLEEKWITPIMDNLSRLPEDFIGELTDKLQALAQKYKVTFAEVGDHISKIEREVSSFAGDLSGTEFDNEGLKELEAILGGVGSHE